MWEDSINTSELPFWWSWQRQRRFDRCPRAYYWHYYGAAGGHEPDAEPRRRKLYHLKHTFNVYSYPVFAVKEALREIFYNSGEVLLETLADRMTASFKFHWRAMLDGSCVADPGLPFLRELQNPDVDRKTLYETLLASLRHTGELLESGITGEILRTPLTARRFLPRPLTVEFGELVCFAEPVLGLVKNGELWFLDGGAPATELRGAVSALLFRHYAVSTEALDPDRVRLFQINLQTGVWGEFGQNSDVTAAQEYIRQSAALLLGKVQNGTACEADFPPAPERGYCRRCRFASVCQFRSGDRTTN